MTKQGLIKHEGSTKSGKWIITKYNLKKQSNKDNITDCLQSISEITLVSYDCKTLQINH